MKRTSRLTTQLGFTGLMLLALGLISLFLWREANAAQHPVLVPTLVPTALAAAELSLIHI